MNGNTIPTYPFAKEFLNAIGYGYVWDFLTYALVIGFAVSITGQLFVLVRGERADFIGVIIKYSLLALLIRYLEPVVIAAGGLVADSGTNLPSIDEEFVASYTALQQSFSGEGSVITPFLQSHPHCSLPNVAVTTLPLPALFSLTTAYLFRLVLLFLFSAAWMAKAALFNWIWPILFNFTGLGVVTALVFSALPGGSQTIVPFFKSLVQITLWPLLYSGFISLTAPLINSILRESREQILCVSSFTINTRYISLFLVPTMLLFGILSIPFVASFLMHHRGTVLAGERVSSATVSLLEKIGNMSGQGFIGTAISSMTGTTIYSMQSTASRHIIVPSVTSETTQEHNTTETIVSERGESDES